jgi:hypothetical protein
MSNAKFKLDGNTPTVTWADPKSAPDHSAASQVNLLMLNNPNSLKAFLKCFRNCMEKRSFFIDANQLIFLVSKFPIGYNQGTWHDGRNKIGSLFDQCIKVVLKIA